MYKENLEIRKIQGLTGDRSFTLVLPKQFAVELGIGKGDFVTVKQEDRKIIVEKAHEGN
jgi:bifunctional DNA-binding transcriptional regulator/antitoxin component of YhaV-PrlF toxin-antitoxin module